METWQAACKSQTSRHVLAFWVSFTLAICGASEAQAQNKIGIIASFSGVMALSGPDISAATQVYKDQSGTSDIVEVYDDSSDSKRVPELLQSAIKSGAKAIVLGPATSAASVRDFARNNPGIPLISLSDSLDLGSDANAIRLIGRSSNLSRYTAELVAVDYPSYTVGLNFDRSVSPPEALTQKQLLDQFSIKNTVLNDQKLRALPGKKIVLLDDPENTLVREVARAGKPDDTVLMIREPVWSESIAKKMPSNVPIVFATNPDLRELPAAKPFVQAAKKYNHNGDGYFLYGVAALQIASASLKQAPANTRDINIRSIAREATFSTALGSLQFDNEGEMRGWRFQYHRGGSGSGSSGGTGFAAVDVCKRQNCSKFTQCPKGCPK
jgi:hypothetical protein